MRTVGKRKKKVNTGSPRPFLSKGEGEGEKKDR